jgi:hypothetical protein
MRVRTNYGTDLATTDDCTNLVSYGETEDYSVVVVSPCSAPTTAASSITFSGITCNQMTVSWTNGNGTSRIVVAKQGSVVSGTPTNNITYTANSVFGNGSTLGTNEYVVYNGSSNSVMVTGLSAGTTYYFKVYEYKCSPELYYTTSPPSASQASSAATTPYAGPDQYICSSVTSATMGATGSGTWTQISGAGATITTPASATTTITGLASGTYVFRWTGTCGTYDDVVIVRQ